MGRKQLNVIEGLCLVGQDDRLLTETDVVYERCRFTRWTFKFHQFKNVVFRNCEFSDCGWMWIRGRNVHFVDCRFERCFVDHWFLLPAFKNEMQPGTVRLADDIQFEELKGDHTMLPGVKLRRSKLDRSQFFMASLERVNFMAASLVGVNFTEAYLMDANFNRANIEGADFSGANLSGASFRYCRGTPLTPSPAPKLEDVRHMDERLRKVLMGSVSVKSPSDS